MLLRPPFPNYLNASTLSAFKACPRKTYLEHFEHWKAKEPSVHLHAGGAYAHGLEHARRAFYEQGLDAEAALGLGMEAAINFYGDFVCPDHVNKSLPRILGALDFYFENYPMAVDHIKPYEFLPGRKAIEFSFATPMPIDHPTTGEPLIYAGRSDMVGVMAGGLFIEDDKTASQLGAAWQSQWDMRSQFTGYCWSARQASLPVDGVLVRGVSLLANKYETQQVITYRRKWEIERWLEQTVREISRMIEMWRAGAFDYNLDESCNAYGGCLFRRVCMSQTPQDWLDGYYEQRVWNPLTHTETVLTDEVKATWEVIT